MQLKDAKGGLHSLSKNILVCTHCNLNMAVSGRRILLCKHGPSSCCGLQRYINMQLSLVSQLLGDKAQVILVHMQVVTGLERAKLLNNHSVFLFLILRDGRKREQSLK